MNRHLIAVEVGIERRADERVNFNRFAFDQNRLESLNSESVQSRSAIQQNRMFADNFFQNIPDNRLLPLDHFTRLLDRRGVRVAFKFVVNKRLEQFQRHFLWQTALM